MTQVILVDKNDKPIGTEEKIAAHLKGKLHRCFSIFLFNSKGEMLLQKRAKEKYHSGGLWSNTCCSHPRPGTKIEEEVKKRLKEELGIEEGLKELKEAFTFIYKADLGKLTEHEFDHVFIGRYDGMPKINPEEVEDFKWVKPEEIKTDIEENSEKYTEWFKIILSRVIKEFNNRKVVIGGTFEIIHEGHRALLKKALELGRVYIGLTSDKMARTLKNRDVKDFESREKNLQIFIKEEFSERAEILKIEDKFGFATEKDFDYIVVSPGTHQTALDINEERKKRDKKPLEIIKINFVLAEDGEPISDTKILNGEINTSGKLVK